MGKIVSFKRVGAAALGLTMVGALVAPGANAHLAPKTEAEVCAELKLGKGVKAGAVLEIEDIVGNVFAKVVVPKAVANATISVCADADVEAEIEIGELELLDDGKIEVSVHVDTDVDADVDVTAKIKAKTLLGVSVAAQVKADIELEAEAELELDVELNGLGGGNLLGLGGLF